MKKFLQSSRKRGQALVEYGLVLALVAILAIAVVKAVGGRIASSFDNVQSQMTAQSITSIAPVAASP